MAQFEFLAAVGLAGLIGGGTALGCGPWYEAPAPTLDYYIKQVPGKSFGDIVGQPAIDKSLPISVDFAIDDLAKKFAQSEKSADRVHTVDEWLTKARASGSPDDDLNLLETVRDAAATEGVSAAELTAFAQWRHQHAGWFSASTADVDHSQAVKDQLDKASPALKPCWMYLAGATLFFSGPLTDSEGWFDQVLAQKEKSPSSEIALYMKARCWWIHAHASQPEKEAGENARKEFHHYLELYPKGRFAADAWGWLGGLEQDDVHALVDYAKQAEHTDHPEVFASAENEVQRIFSNLDYNTGDAGFDEVAQHPELALALTYVIVGTVTTPLAADDSYSPPAPEDQTRLEKWRATALPKLAAAVLAHKDLYQGAVGEDKYLTILAHAASDHGDQDKALDLIRMSEKDANPRDDFLFVRALVLQRAGRLSEAVKSYHQLLDQFPGSALAPGVRYRLALAVHDLKQDGQALLLLSALSDDQLPILYPTNEQDNALPGLSPTYFRPEGNRIYYAVQSYPGANASQIRQTIDSILNFAPVESLAALLKESDPAHDIFRKQLREVVVARYLSQDDFVSAARYVGDPILETVFTDKGAQAEKLQVPKSNVPRNSAPVEQSHTALAASALDLGAYWEGHRFQLTSVPLNPRFARGDYFVNECELIRLQKNGEFLGYGKEEVAHTLDSRDELSHAEALWRKADELDPHGEAAPKAIWKTMQAQRMIAEENPYALQRAIDTHVAEDVKREYDRLIREFPNSIAAKKYAAYWTMPAPGDLFDFEARYPLRDKYPGYDSAVNHYGHPQWFLALKIPFEDDESALGKSWGQVSDQLNKLPSTSSYQTQAEFTQTVNDLRKRAGPLAVLLNCALDINCLDDLVDLGTVPNLDPAVRTEYVTARLNLLSFRAGENSGFFENSGVPTAATPTPLTDNPKAQPIADFIDAFNLSKSADNPVQLANLSQAFLQKYPQSVKRELAAFYRIRGTLNAPAPSGGAPRNFDAVDAAFSDYAKEFPHGKFAHGVLWMQGQEEEMKKNWGPAAHDFALLVDQNAAPELKQDSAFQLALIFDQLKDDDLRHATLVAILADPLARAKLKLYVACGELPFLKDFLIAQVGP